IGQDDRHDQGDLETLPKPDEKARTHVAAPARSYLTRILGKPKIHLRDRQVWPALLELEHLVDEGLDQPAVAVTETGDLLGQARSRLTVQIGDGLGPVGDAADVAGEVLDRDLEGVGDLLEHGGAGAWPDPDAPIRPPVA